jgi:hypothetical protein
VGEAVADETELALLGVLLDGVQEVIFGDLYVPVDAISSWGSIDVVVEVSYLLLGVGPAGDLDDHVKDGLLLIGVEGNVVEGRDGDAILLDEHTVLEGVGLGDLADGVRHFGR